MSLARSTLLAGPARPTPALSRSKPAATRAPCRHRRSERIRQTTFSRCPRDPPDPPPANRPMTKPEPDTPTAAGRGRLMKGSNSGAAEDCRSPQTRSDIHIAGREQIMASRLQSALRSSSNMSWQGSRSKVSGGGVVPDDGLKLKHEPADYRAASAERRKRRCNGHRAPMDSHHRPRAD